MLSITEDDVLMNPLIVISRYEYDSLVTENFTKPFDGGKCFNFDKNRILKLKSSQIVEIQHGYSKKMVIFSEL